MNHRLSNKVSTTESATGESEYSVTYVVCKDQYQRMKRFVWLSTPVPVTDLITDRSGNVHGVVPNKLGSAIDVGLTADAVWDMASDRDVWRVQQPIAGQVIQ